MMIIVSKQLHNCQLVSSKAIRQVKTEKANVIAKQTKRKKV